jgi:hypothetical protein
VEVVTAGGRYFKQEKKQGTEAEGKEVLAMRMAVVRWVGDDGWKMEWGSSNLSRSSWLLSLWRSRLVQ